MRHASVAHQSKGPWAFCSWKCPQCLGRCLAHCGPSVGVQWMNKYTYAMGLSAENCSCHRVLLGKFRPEWPRMGCGCPFLQFGRQKSQCCILWWSAIARGQEMKGGCWKLCPDTWACLSPALLSADSACVWGHGIDSVATSGEHIFAEEWPPSPRTPGYSRSHCPLHVTPLSPSSEAAVQVQVHSFNEPRGNGSAGLAHSFPCQESQCDLDHQWETCSQHIVCLAGFTNDWEGPLASPHAVSVVCC